jgi:hydrogenase expression/formation protein HypE
MVCFDCPGSLFPGHSGSPPGGEASRLGRVTADTPGLVTLKGRIGATRILDLLSGEELPRIC